MRAYPVAKRDRPSLPGGAPDFLGDMRFRRLLSAEAWANLPEAVRRRFAKRLRDGESAVYCGRIAETRLSRAGRWLARLLTVIGGPLPVDDDNEGTPAIVTVTEATDDAGQYWTRQYNRAARFPQVIHSAKAFAGPTGLEECVGGGIGMTLRLRTEPNRLLFVSDRYFCTLFGRRFYLPRFLEPGLLTVGHEDLGGSRFAFTLDLVHPQLGALVHQRIVFRDMTEA